MKNDKIGAIFAYAEASAPVGVSSKWATPLLLLLHTEEQGALCTWFKFLISPKEQFVSHLKVLKQDLFMTQFH